MKSINILIPTYNRAEALAVTLTSLCFQAEKDFDIVISDQSHENTLQQDITLQAVLRLLQSKGHRVTILKNLPAKGMAHQRQFLLEQARAPYVLFIDDDLILEPYVVHNLKKTIQQQQCGFVGAAVIGLSYKQDIRPHQQEIEFWNGKVQPETVHPNSPHWQRYLIHNAANILHLEEKYQASPQHPVKYKVAWVGGCVMYDSEKLKQAGAFGFWKELPMHHCGEDVLAQLRVMKISGGCGIIPSGVYHQELATTVTDRKVNAPEVLDV